MTTTFKPGRTPLAIFVILLFLPAALSFIQCNIGDAELTRACCTTLNGTLNQDPNPPDDHPGLWCDLSHYEEAAGSVGQGRAEATNAWHDCPNAVNINTTVGIGCTTSSNSRAGRRAPLPTWGPLVPFVILLFLPAVLSAFQCHIGDAETTRECCTLVNGTLIQESNSPDDHVGLWCNLSHYEEAAGDVEKGRAEASQAWYGCGAASANSTTGVACTTEPLSSRAGRRAPVPTWGGGVLALLLLPATLMLG
jgi:hypothetical protein